MSAPATVPVSAAAGKGSYVLLLRNQAAVTIQVGKSGMLQTKRGYYLYVGSAFGSGGLDARLRRHFRSEKRHHWHIDYLRDRMQPVDAWCSY